MFRIKLFERWLFEEKKCYLELKNSDRFNVANVINWKFEENFIWNCRQIHQSEQNEKL